MTLRFPRNTRWIRKDEDVPLKFPRKFLPRQDVYVFLDARNYFQDARQREFFSRNRLICVEATTKV